MLILLNNREWAKEDDVLAWLAATKEVVSKIEVDGREYEGSLEQALQEEGIREIRITSLPLEQLLTEAKESVRDYLPKLEAGARKVSYLLQSGQEGEAFDLVLHLINGLDWLIQAVNAINTLEPGYFSQEKILTFKEKAEELLAAWHSRDYVLISDLFEYELAPLLNEWGATLNKI